MPRKFVKPLSQMEMSAHYATLDTVYRMEIVMLEILIARHSLLAVHARLVGGAL